MLSSKANAALARLKEIEEKYKTKREEQKWKRKENTDSSISSPSIISLENLSTELKESPKSVTKLKLDIKMPNTQFEAYAEETNLSSESTLDKVSPKSFEKVDKVDPRAAISPLEDKSSFSVGKQESFISDVTTIEENSSIESVLDDSVTPSRSLSRSKTSQRNLSTVDAKFSGHEGRIKVAVRLETRKDSTKSEISREKISSDDSSTKRSRLSGNSNEFPKARSGLRPKERSSDERAVKTSEAANSSLNSTRSASLRDNSVIEESIGTVKDISEIISELSRAEESITTKTENSADISESKHLNASATILNGSKNLEVENGYAYDTFEDISSSTKGSKSRSQRMLDERKEIFNPAGSNAKKLNIVSQKESYHNGAESLRDGRVIELVAPKPSATEVGLEPSSYVSDFESIHTNPDNATMRLIKSPKSNGSRSEKQRKRYQRRMDSFEEDVPSVASSNKNISDSSIVARTDEEKNHSEMRTISVRQKSGRQERGKTLNETREHAIINVTGSVLVNDENRIELAKSNLSADEEKTEDIIEASSDQQISQDVEIALRKLLRDANDALAKRRASSKTAKKPSEVRDTASMGRMTTKEKNKSHRFSERDQEFDRNGGEHSINRKKVEVTNSAKTRNSIKSRKEDKAWKFDGKQMRGLRKRIVELRLQQEREDFQRYLHELKELRPESDSTQNYFSPLEFPKIAEFVQSDAIDSESKPDDRRVALRERVSTIRRWLRDQYILYRDYCTMAQAINAHYVPTRWRMPKRHSNKSSLYTGLYRAFRNTTRKIVILREEINRIKNRE